MIVIKAALGLPIQSIFFSQSGSMPFWGVAFSATTLFQRIRSSAMTTASGMPTPLMSFETTDSQEFRRLPGGVFHCDGVGIAIVCLVSLNN